jgi:hypothetical protein
MERLSFASESPHKRDACATEAQYLKSEIYLLLIGT